MKSKGSLPRSQQPVTCPHPATHKSSQACPFYSFKNYFNIILPPTQMFSKEFFRKVAPLKPHAKFILCTGYTPHPPHLVVLSLIAPTVLSMKCDLLSSSLCNTLHSPSTSHDVALNTFLSTPDTRYIIPLM